MYDFYFLRELLINILDGCYGGAKRVAFVIVVEGIEQSPVFTHKSRLGGGRACVDSKECLSLIGSHILNRNLMLVMAVNKCMIIGLCGKQRLHTLHFKFHLNPPGKAVLHFLDRNVQIPF